METKKQKFGRRIRFLCEQAGISQSKFALMIGMNQAYLSGIENGRRNISFDNIEKNCKWARCFHIGFVC